MQQQQFDGQNCQRKSFRGRDLRNANFRGADIRGANFTGADLTRADFTNARAGIPEVLIIPFALIFGGASILITFLSTALLGLLAAFAFIWSAVPDAPFLIGYIPAGLSEIISELLLLSPLNHYVPMLVFLGLLLWFWKILLDNGTDSAREVIIFTIASAIAIPVSVYVFTLIYLIINYISSRLITIINIFETILIFLVIPYFEKNISLFFSLALVSLVAIAIFTLWIFKANHWPIDKRFTLITAVMVIGITISVLPIIINENIDIPNLGVNLSTRFEYFPVLLFSCLTATVIAIILASTWMVVFLLSSTGFSISNNILQIACGRQFQRGIFNAAKVFIIIGSILGGVESWNRATGTHALVVLTSVLLSGFFSGLAGWLILHISDCSLSADLRFFGSNNIATQLIAPYGTQFINSLLVEADFTNARISGTNFRQADLTRVNWKHTYKLHQAAIDLDYLNDPQISQLVCKKQASEKIDLSYRKLPGINLSGADLRGLNFEGAELYGSDLREANLNNTSFIRTNLDAAILTRSNLTGACIENWRITKSTYLGQVICDYIYMQAHSPEIDSSSRDFSLIRLPNKGNFKPGEFEEFQNKLTNAIAVDHPANTDLSIVVKALKHVSSENSLIFEVLTIGKNEDRLSLKILPKSRTTKPLNVFDTRIKEDYYRRYKQLFEVNATKNSNIREFDDSEKLLETLTLLKRKLDYCSIFLYNRGIVIHGADVDITINPKTLLNKREDS